MKKIIFTENFTTVSNSHFLESLSFLTYKLPFLRKGKYIGKIESHLLDYLGVSESKIVSFYNARSALYHAFKMLKIKKSDEIIVNGYNCISVINSIIQSKATPVYCDISSYNYGFNLKDLESKITKKTKIIVLQHSFGKSGNINELLKIAKKYNILVIEDCAHSLGSEYDGRKHGIFGDFSIFSTGRDKVISGVNGGFLVINNPKYFKKSEAIKKHLKQANIALVVQNNLYNIFGFISYKTYNFFSFGKILIYIARKLKLFNEVLSKQEKKCKEDRLNYLLPNSLAKLALDDMRHIDKYTNDRRSIYEYYLENINSSFCKIPFFENKNELNNAFRVPLLFESKELKNDFFEYMKKNGIIMGNSWSDVNIAPKGSSFKNAKYTKTKNAEKIASRILFLANHKFVTADEVRYITDLINKYNK